MAEGQQSAGCCLFTCMNTCAVHLELVKAMNTDDFIMCLRRFIDRSGKVSELRCNRGSNFVGVEQELAEGFFSVLGQLTILKPMIMWLF